ncbi:hypothetical protein PSTG_17219 [Puccinia striiformis f. sp. tritici PST-78]|uniref:Uncharacterized protein n=1 Tax=Puccinia striiformis f. sp. tritici PST-78 TaxID=1165861 RepID=A0A0L0UQX9_9BASI|nr:hypothetical protein PSTG_17219 [Puccinia striiformis f. sp. tritici PST-78]
MEDAYAEFIGSGGHSSRTINPDLNKVDRKNAVLGSQVAIQTIELSMQSFKPESVTYYGKVTGVNDVSIALRLDPRSISTTTSEDKKDDTERKGDDDGGEEGEEWFDEEEQEEERMVDVKETITARHRRSFARDLSGLSRLNPVTGNEKLFLTLVNSNLSHLEPPTTVTYAERSAEQPLEVWSTFTLLLKQTKTFSGSEDSSPTESVLKRKRPTMLEDQKADGLLGLLRAQSPAASKSIIKSLNCKSIAVQQSGFTLLYE